jgi:hypothetical protein
MFERALTGLPYALRGGMTAATVFQFLWMVLVVILPPFVYARYSSRIKLFLALILVFSLLQVVISVQTLNFRYFYVPDAVLFLMLYLLIFIPLLRAARVSNKGQDQESTTE